MLLNSFNHTIGFWIEALEEYTFEQLCAKPTPDSRALGQLYTHLVDDTNYYIEQIKYALLPITTQMKKRLHSQKHYFQTIPFRIL